MSAYTQFENKPAVVTRRDKNKTKEEMLWKAIKEKSLVDVVNYLHAGARVNDGDPYGNTAVQIAAEMGTDEIMKEILDADDVKVNSKDKLGQTALMFAAVNGHYHMCDALIAAKASVNMVTVDGQSALHKAAYGHYQHTSLIVQMLHKHKVKVDLPRADGRTALMIASEGGSIDVVTYLLNAKADANAKCKVGNTALHYTAATGSAALVQLLVCKGADASIKNQQGKTCVQVAFKGTALSEDGEALRVRLTEAIAKGKEGKMPVFKRGRDEDEEKE